MSIVFLLTLSACVSPQANIEAVNLRRLSPPLETVVVISQTEERSLAKTVRGDKEKGEAAAIEVKDNRKILSLVKWKLEEENGGIPTRWIETLEFYSEDTESEWGGKGSERSFSSSFRDRIPLLFEQKEEGVKITDFREKERAKSPADRELSYFEIADHLQMHGGPRFYSSFPDYPIRPGDSWHFEEPERFDAFAPFGFLARNGRSEFEFVNVEKELLGEDMEAFITSEHTYSGSLGREDDIEVKMTADFFVNLRTGLVQYLECHYRLSGDTEEPEILYGIVVPYSLISLEGTGKISVHERLAPEKNSTEEFEDR